MKPVSTAEMAMGAVMASGRLARRSARTASRLASPVVRIAVDPPLVPYRWRPIRRLEEWGRDWQSQRGSLVRRSVEATTELAAGAAEIVLPLVDLTPLVRSVIDRLDLDAIAVQALDDLDLSAVADQVIDELDVGSVIEAALVEVNLTEIVVDQVDLGRVVVEALDELDLTDIVLSRVDLNAVVYAVLDTLDLTALVQERVDLAGVAQTVMDDIDLPQIIQESTGSVASEAVQSARLASVDADEAISRFADKILLRARRRGVQSGAELEGESHDGEQP